MRLVYSHEWPVHLRVTSEEASRKDRPREALHEIYDIAMVLDTDNCLLNPANKSIRLLDSSSNPNPRQPHEVNLPSPSLYVSAGFPCHMLLVFDSAGRHIADVSLSLHSAVHIAGVPATNESLLMRYHIGRVLIHRRLLYVADCEFDLVYVCDLAGDVRHVISWPEELCAPMGMWVGPDRLYVCDSGHKRVRVYDLEAYRPVPGEDSPGHFPGVHTRGVCRLVQPSHRLVVGDFESGHLLSLDGIGDAPKPPRRLDAPIIGEPFAIVPGPLPDTVFVSSSRMQGDHSVKLVSVAPSEGSNDGGGSSVLATCGGVGSAPGQFNKPRGLAFDAVARRLYVVDARNYRIQVFLVEA